MLCFGVASSVEDACVATGFDITDLTDRFADVFCGFRTVRLDCFVGRQSVSAGEESELLTLGSFL